MMHYSGMNAMSIAGHIRWDPILVIASIALGMLFAAFAMWSFKENGSRLFAAGLLTAAICILHFTAMGAATVEYDPPAFSNPGMAGVRCKLNYPQMGIV